MPEFAESKRIGRDWLVKGSGEIIRKLLGFGLTALAARRLGSSQFGDYTTLFTIANMLALLFDSGLTTVQIREISRRPDAEGTIVTAVALIRVLLSLAVLGLLAGMTALFRVPPETARSLLYLSLFWIFTIGVEMIGGVFAARRKFYQEAVVLVWQKAFLLLVVALVLLSGGQLGGFIAAHAVASGVAFLMAVGYLFRKGISPHRPALADLRYLLVEAAPLALSLALTLMYFKFDVLLLRWFRDATEVGYYGAAYRVLELAMAAPATLTAVLFPVLARRATADSMQSFMRRCLIGATVLGMVCAAVLGVLARPVIGIIYGAAFAPAGPVLALLSFALVLIWCNFILLYSLIALGRQRINAMIAAFCLLANAVLNLGAVPLWGMYGAAATTGVTELLLCVLSLYYCGVFSRASNTGGKHDS